MIDGFLKPSKASKRWTRQASKSSKVKTKRIWRASKGEDAGFQGFGGWVRTTKLQRLEGEEEAPLSSPSKPSKPLSLRPHLQSLQSPFVLTLRSFVFTFRSFRPHPFEAFEAGSFRPPPPTSTLQLQTKAPKASTPPSPKRRGMQPQDALHVFASIRPALMALSLSTLGPFDVLFTSPCAISDRWASRFYGILCL